MKHLTSIKLLRSKFSRFLIVGITSVAIDFVIYLLLLFLGFETDLAKAVSFINGAIFAYFANRGFTFQSKRKDFSGFFMFSTLYILSLMINVTMNELVLSLLGRTKLIIIFAFLIATGLSATINYVGMKNFIFNK
jgi:polyisoprenyl-phosphate glycosyltransferase